MCGRVLKTTKLSAQAQNHVSLEWDSKLVTTIILSDHDFQLRVSNFGDLAAFRAIVATFSMRTRRNSYIYELPVKTFASEFNSSTPISS